MVNGVGGAGLHKLAIKVLLAGIRGAAGIGPHP